MQAQAATAAETTWEFNDLPGRAGAGVNAAPEEGDGRERGRVWVRTSSENMETKSEGGEKRKKKLLRTSDTLKSEFTPSSECSQGGPEALQKGF